MADLKTLLDLSINLNEVSSLQDNAITTANTWINQTNTRCRALLILDIILPQCNKEILLKYATLWLSKAILVLESVHSDVKALTLTCKVIGKLISQCKEIHDIQKQISMQYVKQIITAITNLNENNVCGATFYLLATLLHYYPEICEKFQGIIRKFIFLNLDSSDKCIINGSARCFVLLVKAIERSYKPSGTKSNYTAWTYNQVMICSSLHNIINELFPNLMELNRDEEVDNLELPELYEDNILKVHFKQEQRFTNLCSLLATMLNGVGQKVSVMPNDILKLLCRGLAIIPTNLNATDSYKEQLLYIILPQLHIGLLSVLEAFINGYRQELIPFGTTILQLCNQTLSWTEINIENKISYFNSKPFTNVRKALYKCLATWLKYNNSSSGIETIIDNILHHILKDIIPDKDRVLLTIKKTQSLSKRALKRLRDSQYTNSVHLNNTSIPAKAVYIDDRLCIEALLTLQNIFFSNCWLKPNFYKNIQNVIVPLLYDYYFNSLRHSFYNNSTDCRLQLLRCLRFLMLNPNLQTAPPTQYAIEIFEMAIRDNDTNIMQEAKIALSELEKIVHPAAPTIQLVKVNDNTNSCLTVLDEEITQESQQIHKNIHDTILRDENSFDLSKRKKLNETETEQDVEIIEKPQPPVNTLNLIIESSNNDQREELRCSTPVVLPVLNKQMNTSKDNASSDVES
ncbi:proline-, glutamic acid- and leucine-rich protein 1-like isoform X2 [Prorops nasuta]